MNLAAYKKNYPFRPNESFSGTFMTATDENILFFQQ